MMYPGRNSYNKFKVTDLINDPFFQDWVLHPTDSNESFWQQWIQENPERRQVVEEARKVLLSVRFTTHWPSDEQAQDSLLRTMTLIENQHSETSYIPLDHYRHTGRWIVRITTWRHIAAVLTGFVLLGTLLYLYRYRNTIELETTGFGILKTIYLPDSSQVVLNAHSTLRYDRSWAMNGRRELWLEGEAFFDVRHGNISSQKGQRYAGFIVHTAALNVEVLGTSFDIRQRRGNTEVVLLNGKIKISSPGAAFETIWMNPGDKIRYDSAEHRIYRSSAVPEEYASWKDKKLVLTNAPLSGIIRYIEDNYGKTIQLQDPKMANRTVGGEIYLDNLQDALFILSKTLDIVIEDQGDTILFKLK
jgi:transmembrane sensor